MGIGASRARPARSMRSTPNTSARSSRARSSASTTAACTSQPVRCAGRARRTLRLRARLFRQPRQQCLRPERAPHARSHGPATRQRIARRTPTASCPCPTPAAAPRWAIAKESGLPFEEGIVPNRFVGRTFIMPNQLAARPRRQHEAQHHRQPRQRQPHRRRRRFGRPRHDHALQDARLRGAEPKRSIFASAARRSAIPAFTESTSPRRNELVAHNRTIDQIRDFIEVDSLSLSSLEGMLACMKFPASDCCTACWSGQYKIPIDQPTSKFSFERDQLKMF